MTFLPGQVVTLPVCRDASWDDFAWAPKHPSDVADHLLDCTRWLGGDTIISADFGAIGATVVSRTYAGAAGAHTGVVVRIGGGVPHSTAQVGIIVKTAGGDTVNAVVLLPILGSLSVMLEGAAV